MANYDWILNYDPVHKMTKWFHSWLSKINKIKCGVDKPKFGVHFLKSRVKYQVFFNIPKYSVSKFYNGL